MKIFFIKLILVLLMLCVIGNIINMFMDLLLNNDISAIKHFSYTVFCAAVGIFINSRYKKVLN